MVRACRRVASPTSANNRPVGLGGNATQGAGRGWGGCGGGPRYRHRESRNALSAEASALLAEQFFDRGVHGALYLAGRGDGVRAERGNEISRHPDHVVVPD